MNTDEWFIDLCKLPPVLTSKETQALFIEMKNGSKSAREKLIVHNIRLVLYEVAYKFKTVGCDKKDLVSAGNIGLVNAIDTYDPTKNNKFAGYAATCITNEIYSYLKSLKKHQAVSSIDLTLSTNDEGIEFQISDTMQDNNDLVLAYETKEKYQIIRDLVMQLPERNRNIVIMYFGFSDDKRYNKREIAEIYNLTPSTIGRIITNVVNDIRKELEKRDIIELSEKNRHDIKFNHKGGYKLNSIYAYFSDYTKEQIDEIIATLSEEEKQLLVLRYGDDLDNPTRSYITTQTRSKFYNQLLPKIKKLLKNNYQNN